jgi:hypothetical protein
LIRSAGGHLDLGEDEVRHRDEEVLLAFDPTVEL